MNNDLRYVLGLDIGIASVGWAVVELDENYEPYRIIDVGVRAFNAAELPKTGESLNKVRRDARSARRRLKRRKSRLRRLKRLFLEHGFVNSMEDFSKNVDKWALRAKALDEQISKEEIAHVVLHLAKYRGFKSNRKNLEATGDEGKMKQAITQIKEELKSKGYRTYGEMLYKDPAFVDRKHNTTDDYRLSIDRESIKKELELILDKQRDFYPELSPNSELYSKIVEIWGEQKPFMTEELIKEMVGKCSLDPTTFRAPKAYYTFEKFRLLQAINHIRIVTYEDKNGRPLTKEERDVLIRLAHKQKSAVSFGKIRKVLKLDAGDFFKSVPKVPLAFRADKENHEKLPSLPAFHRISEVLQINPGEYNSFLPEELEDLYNKIAEVFTYNRSDEDIAKHLKNLNLEESLYTKLLESDLSFSGFARLSLETMQKLIPFLEQGLTYDKAVEKAGFSNDKYSGEKFEKLPAISTEDITNPVVVRSLAQTRKVINAVIDKYGLPTMMRIEMARDLGRNWKERKKIQREQAQNRAKKEMLLQAMKEHFNMANPSFDDYLKYKLYEEQNGQCAYSGKSIDINRLFEPNYVQIDHALPISRSLNDSYNNKVLVLTSENQNKRNQTPWEYFDGANNSDRWKRFVTWVEATYKEKNPKKMDLLLTEGEPPEGFLNRDINDTRYIVRFLANYVKKTLRFREFDSDGTQHVFTVNGRITAWLRTHWGLQAKERDVNSRHHAIDAIVVAVASPSTVQKITRTLQEFNSSTSHEKIIIPSPWEDFRHDANIRVYSDKVVEKLSEYNNLKELYENILNEIRPILVSKPPRRKVTGLAHDSTLFSPKLADQGILIKRQNVSNLTKVKDLEKMYDKEGGAKPVYDVLREALETESSLDNLYKPSKSNNKNKIKRVKLTENSGTFKYLHNKQAVAKNGKMVCVKVYEKDNKTFLVPVYVHHFAKNSPEPTKIAGSGNKHVDDSYEYKFSLFPGEYIEIYDRRNNELIGEGYYVKIHSTGGHIIWREHDSVGSGGSIDHNKGAQGIKIAKVEISVLGDKLSRRF